MPIYVQKSTYSILSEKGLPVFSRHLGQIGAVRDLIALLNWPYQMVVSQGISELERFWARTEVSPISVPQADELYLSLLEVLQQWYVFRGERTEILRFLERYPFLVLLLVEAYYYIEKFFPQSLVFLTVVTDPEEFGADQLVAFISTDLDPDEAVNALSAFDKKWWLNSLKQAQGKLCITLEFR